MTNFKQYGRKISLIAEDENGKGFDLSELRVVFSIDKKFTNTPNDGIVTIYNISENTKQKFLKGEFVKLFLEAGYIENSGIIISGEIKDKRAGLENGTDTFIEVAVADSDKGYNFSITNTTLAAGSTPTDHLDVCLKSLDDFGVGTGQIDVTDSYSLPRSKTMFGMTRNHLRTIGFSTGSQPTIQDGDLQVIDRQNTTDIEAVELNTATGLIDSPQQTIEGINAKSLLNPRLKINGQIHLNEADVQAASVDALLQSANPSIAADGFYRIIWLTHSGDTRGNDWYTTMTATSMDKTKQQGEQVIG